MTRKIILNFHIYGGLLCFSYLIIFGLSSIMINHDLPARPQSAEAEAQLVKVSWEQPGPLPDFQTVNSTLTSSQREERIKQNNEKVRTALGLFGLLRPWKSQWDSPPYRASLSRPGRSYTVEVDVESQKMKVLEARSGIMTIIKELHGEMALSGSGFASSWRFYTDLCAVVVLFAAGSGLYLWTRRRDEWRIGLILLGSATVFSLGLMLYITLHG